MGFIFTVGTPVGAITVSPKTEFKACEVCRFALRGERLVFFSQGLSGLRFWKRLLISILTSGSHPIGCVDSDLVDQPHAGTTLQDIYKSQDSDSELLDCTDVSSSGSCDTSAVSDDR